MSIKSRITAALIASLALSAGGAVTLAATNPAYDRNHRAHIRHHPPRPHKADTTNCSTLNASINSSTDPQQIAALKAQIQNQCVDPNQPATSGPKPPAQNGNPGPPPTDTTGKTAGQTNTPSPLPPTKPTDQPGR